MPVGKNKLSRSIFDSVKLSYAIKPVESRPWYSIGETSPGSRPWQIPTNVRLVGLGEPPGKFCAFSAQLEPAEATRHHSSSHLQLLQGIQGRSCSWVHVPIPISRQFSYVFQDLPGSFPLFSGQIPGIFQTFSMKIPWP